MEMDNELIEKIKLLEQKFKAMGQDLSSYLDGLLHSDYLSYWDYVNTDVLLDLQKPKTSFPDEMIFILYHQITELYFKLILHAVSQVQGEKELSVSAFQTQIRRINSYFKNLVSSFEIMIDGMDMEQFRQFRMALLPASGFQSAQYRFIELASTDIHNLLASSVREELKNERDLDKLLANLYWKKGATELATGKKTLTLKRFEEKYGEQFRKLTVKYHETNLYALYKKLSEKNEISGELKQDMREMDMNANIYWPLMHMKAASSYLVKEPDVIAATGGTNWQQYLPPGRQLITFFPSLFSEEELKNWGRVKRIDKR